MNELLDSLKIILDCDPRNVNDKGVEQPTASGEQDAPKTTTKASAEFSGRQWDTPIRGYRS